ncbi:MAG: PLP-dependent aminotransferase family protein [Saprospiraceae bacterium]
MMPILNPNLLSMKSDVMGFLNEALLRFPEAISLASGRPSAKYFDLRESLDKFDAYVKYRMAETGESEAFILSDLGQYNRAQGIINGELAKFLAKDEQIKVDPEDIIVTVGAQEAMMLILTTLCHPAHHSIAIENPSYIGMSTYAKIADYEVASIPTTPEGLDLSVLEESIAVAKSNGKPIRLLYTIPDYQNPTGNLMPLAARKALLAKAEEHDFYILEDNAYGYFNYEGEKIPSIKSLDEKNRTIYVGSFSKILFPSLRLAVVAAGQSFEFEGKTLALSKQISTTKAYVSLNTPSINQAILGAYLRDNDFSLVPFSEEKVTGCSEKRAAMLSALEKYLGNQVAVKWRKPAGGFFLTLEVPFKVEEANVIECAEQYKVIFCPMSFFYLDGIGGDHEIRLAFSNLEPAEITTAIERLAKYILSKLKA